MSKMFDYISGQSNGEVARLEASLEHTAGYLGLEIEEGQKLRKALHDLERAELEYRNSHDAYGASDMRTGRAWDAMRRAGDQARAVLANPTKAPLTQETK